LSTIKLYKPHPKQLEIHEALEREDIMYCVASIGRQFGKSLLGENQGCKWALEKKNWTILWISPTYKQCKKVFQEMVSSLGKCPAYSKPPHHSDLILSFATGCSIKFYSAEAYNSIRGESADALILDEFRDFHPNAWQEAIKPTLTVKGKKVLIISTPKGKGQFYGLHQQGMNGEPRYISFKGSSYDNPYANIEEINDAKRNLPEHIFKQEYLAEFIEDGSEVFINIDESVKQSTKTPILFAGIDLGRADDYTVLTIVNEKDEEVYCERWRHMDWSKIIGHIVDTLNRYKPYTLIEANGAQDAIYEQIRNMVNFNKAKVMPFVTTSKSKQSIIENLIVKFENKEIGILGYDYQLAELQAFTYEYNIKTRAIKYSAPLGLHDDYVMSRAITSQAHRTMKKKGTYNIVT
jgi:hypothetical protein